MSDSVFIADSAVGGVGVFRPGAADEQCGCGTVSDPRHVPGALPDGRRRTGVTQQAQQGTEPQHGPHHCRGLLRRLPRPDCRRPRRDAGVQPPAHTGGGGGT